MRTMTTKQAALLAAVGTTLALLVAMVSSFRWVLAPGVWHDPRSVLSVLLLFPLSVILMAALPVFFVCAYLNEPPLVIRGSVRRPALVAAIATGLSAANTVFNDIRGFISSWEMDGNPLMRASHPLQWFWDWPLRVLISILGAIVVPLFFFTIWKRSTESGPVNPRLKRAALYAGIVAAFGAVSGVYWRVSSEIFMSTDRALLEARGGTAVEGLWYRILQTALALFYSGSLAWFFFLLGKKAPATQSSQRLSNGE